MGLVDLLSEVVGSLLKDDSHIVEVEVLVEEHNEGTYHTYPDSSQSSLQGMHVEPVQVL